MKSKQIIIIGAGLTGLTLACLLEKEGISATILEARERLGGRIYTSRAKDQAPIEMGATWLGTKHKYLLNLLKDLNIDIYEQYMGKQAYYEPISTSPPQLVTLPPNDEPTYRIKGGTDNLIHTLAKQWNNSNIILNQVVESIRREKDIIHINTTEDLFKAKIVVSTLPPKLLAENIAFTPSLPSSLDQTCRSTHTWMGEAIKVGLTYRNPFWRKPGTSGTIMSNVGPIFEMYDHSNYEDTLFALKGFMNNAYHAISKTERKKLIIAQLIKFYGKQAEKFQSYQETVWKHEPYTYSKYSDSIIPHQNNGNPQFGKPNWNGSLFIAGSETAATYPGYMDGAVESAIQTVKKIKETFGS